MYSPQRLMTYSFSAPRLLPPFLRFLPEAVYSRARPAIRSSSSTSNFSVLFFPFSTLLVPFFYIWFLSSLSRFSLGHDNFSQKDGLTNYFFSEIIDHISSVFWRYIMWTWIIMRCIMEMNHQLEVKGLLTTAKSRLTKLSFDSISIQLDYCVNVWK